MSACQLSMAVGAASADAHSVPPELRGQLCVQPGQLDFTPLGLGSLPALARRWRGRDAAQDRGPQKWPKENQTGMQGAGVSAPHPGTSAQ